MNTFRKHLILKGTQIKDALKQLDILARDAILFVVDKKGKLIGSLTDGDVRRGLLKGFSINHLVDDIIHPHPRYIRKGERDINKVIEYRENNYRIIPILNKNDQVVNVINFRNIRSYLPVDAVIMAGGRGERLRPLTDAKPKPLLPVGNKSILEHNLDRLRLFGIDDLWITLKYLGKMIEEKIGNGKDKDIDIQFIYEEEPMGTVGSITRIKNFVHDYVLITNSDLLSNIDYEHFFMDFLKKEADFSVVTIPYDVNVPYAVLETSNGHVLSLKEKPTYTYYSNGGIYLMKQNLKKIIPIEKHFNTTDLIEELIKEGKKVVSYPLAGYWLDIGRLEDYEKAQNDINTIKF